MITVAHTIRSLALLNSEHTHSMAWKGKKIKIKKHGHKQLLYTIVMT